MEIGIGTLTHSNMKGYIADVVFTAMPNTLLELNFLKNDPAIMENQTELGIRPD